MTEIYPWNSFKGWSGAEEFWKVKKEEKRKMDVKDKYQRQAEELALTEHGKEYDELDEDTQFEIFSKAEVLVGEKLQLAADNLREDLELRFKEKEGYKTDKEEKEGLFVFACVVIAYIGIEAMGVF